MQLGEAKGAAEQDAVYINNAARPACPLTLYMAPLMERQPYDTNLSDAEWERIRCLLPGPCACGRPIEVPRRAIVNAILYVLRGGCCPTTCLAEPWSTGTSGLGGTAVCGSASVPRCGDSCAGPRAGRPRPAQASSTASP